MPELTGSRRHGKHLFAAIGGDGGWLRPDHAVLVLDFPADRHLAYVNTRKLGELGIVDDVDEFVTERPGSKRARLIAGLGDIYADEILFQAGIHPETEVGALDDRVVGELHRVLCRVLRKAIDGRVETFPDSWLLPRREKGAECPRCGNAIEKSEVAGRATYLCPGHQAAP